MEGKPSRFVSAGPEQTFQESRQTGPELRVTKPSSILFIEAKLFTGTTANYVCK